MQGSKLTEHRLKPVPAALRTEAERTWEHYAAACDEAGLPLPVHPELIAMLHRIWTGSAFVAQSCISHPHLLAELLASGDLHIEYPHDGHARRLAAVLAGCRDETALAHALRRWRRREMMRIAWRDLAGWSGLEQTLRETSWLAEAAIDGALSRLHEWGRAEHGRPSRGDGTEQSLVVLGMGKLGAYELNFSSDIDLILVYGEEGETHGRRRRISNEAFFTELGRRLIAALGSVDEEGFVFRVDMRLRPYGDSGPLVMSLTQMEDYYQIQGREWERYAMIKARPVGGDRDTGYRLLQMLRPFVYRKYLDFGVFESLREMKAMIDREATRREMENDIKLGPGGIREIEFIGQTYQLIRGGREPALRTRGILQVLSLLARAGHLPERSCIELADSYRFLRRVENRLQIYADAQTHRLPEADNERRRLAWTMGYDDPAAFERTLDEHRQRVRTHFERVFSGGRRDSAPPPAGSGPDYAALWTQGAKTDDEAAPTTLATPHTLAFGEEGLRRLALLRDSYLYRSLSSRGRARMDRLMPLVLETVAAAENPPVTLLRVLELIELIARRTAYLALLAENPAVLNQMTRLCAASPWIARMIGAQPLLLDELIDTRALYRPLERTALAHELATRLSAIDADDLEQQMEALRQFKQANVLRVAAADIGDAMPLMIVSDHLTDIAEVCLAEVLRLAAAQTLRRNREAQRAIERGFAIIAYGKLAGIELGYGSDLDIVFLHGDTSEGNDAQIFPRLGQRVIHMLGAHTPAGILYPVDLRLRPSGTSGLLVSSISSFEDYQRSQAWTWEHQALVRARVVAWVGNDTVSERFTAVRGEVLARPRDAETLRGEIRDMRERMRRELSRGGPGLFDIKQDRGGIADIEFIVQYAVLRWAHAHPALLYWTDNIRLLQTLEDTALLERDTVRTMIDCYRGYRARVHRLALQEMQEAVVPAEDFSAERAAVSALWEHLIGSAESPPTVK